MPETVVRYTFQVTNAEEVVNAAQKAEAAVDRLTRRRASATIDADTEAFNRKMATIENTTARMRAQRIGIPIDANIDQATAKIETLKRQTRELNALASQTKITVDVSQLHEADRTLGSIGSKLGNIVAYSAGYQAFRLVEQGITAAGQAMIGFNAELEQSRIAFTNALGSASAAGDFLNQLESFAARTPFQFSDVTKLSQELLAMGIRARDVIPDLTAIGDAVAGVGGSADILQRVVLAFGQINTAGRANAQDLRQFTEAGVNAFQYLADAMHTTTENVRRQVEAGTVSSATALNAIITGINRDFGGMMETQSKTLIGRVSNLKDDFAREMADVGQPLFRAVSEAVDQISQLIKTDQFKQVAAGIAQDVTTLIHAVEALAEGFSHIPAPIITAAIHLGELVVAFKAIEVVIGTVRSTLAPVAALLGLQTTALTTQTAALGANTAAWTARNAASTGGGAAGVGGTAAGGGLLAGLGGLATGGAATGTAATGIGAGVAVVVLAGWNSIRKVAEDVIERGLDEWQETVKDAIVRIPFGPTGGLGVVNLLNDVVKALSGEDMIHLILDKSGILDLPQTVQDAIASLPTPANAAIGIVGGLPVAIASRAGDIAGWAGIGGSAPGSVTGPPSVGSYGMTEAELADARRGSQRQFQNIASEALENVRGLRTAETPQQVQEYADVARQALTDLAHTYENLYGETDKYEKLLRNFLATLDDTTDATKRQLVQGQQQHDEMLRRADEIRQHAAAVGLAEPFDIMAGLGGTDKASADQIKLIEDRYKDLVEAQKEAFRAMQQAQRDYVQQLTQTAEQARRAVSGIDLSKGLAGLAAVAPDLQRARDAIGGFGMTGGALNALTQIADQWKAIADAEDEASQAMKGYLLTFDETDRRIAVLDNLKKKIDDGVKAAKEAKEGGYITPEQQKLLDQAGVAYANIAEARNKLVTNQVNDIFGIGQNLPDLQEADNTMRSMVDRAGGGKQIIIDVKTAMDEAQRQIDDFVNEPRTMTIKAVIDTSQIPDWIKNLPPGALGGGASPAYYPDANIDAGGVFGPTPGTPPGSGGASTQTPHGDAAKLAQWKQYIDQAARQYGIDPYLLGAIIMHESSGTPGIVNPNGGASGLTQVFPAAHPGLDYEQLRGTSNSDIWYQIEQGAKILAGHIASQGGNVPAGIANYGGYNASDMSYYNDLQKYLPGVKAALGGGNVAAPGSNAQGALSGVGQQIVQNALSQVGLVQFVNQCEKWVEEQIEAVTGRRGATGQRETSATSAFASAQRMGLQITKQQAQPGDLVYYPDANGDGHVAIYMGGGKQVSTYDRGGTAIHVEDIFAGAQFVHVPGVGPGGAVVGPKTGPGAVAGAAASAAFGTWNAFDPNTEANQRAVEKQRAAEEALKNAIAGATAAQDEFGAALKRADPRNVAQIQQEFNTLLPIFDKIESKKLGPDPTDIEKQTAMAKAYAQTADTAAAWADALTAIDSGSGDVAAAQKRIAEVAAGPVADALNAELDIMQEVKATSDTIASLNDRKAQLDRQQRVEARADEDRDRARQRQQTLEARRNQDQDRDRQRSQQLEQRDIQDERDARQRQWRDEDTRRQNDDRARQVRHQYEMRRIEDETRAENDRYTKLSRAQEDASRDLEHYGTLQKRQLQDEQRARENANRDATASRSAQIQLAQGAARAAGTNVEATQAGAALAALKDAQVSADELFKQQTDANKVLQDEQDRLASEQLYNLETQRIASQRVHEDALSAIDKEATASNRAFEDESNRIQIEDMLRSNSHQLQTDLWADEDKARQRRYEDEQFNIEGARIARSRALEDEQFAIETERANRARMYEDAQQAIDEEIKAQEKLLEEEKNRLSAAESALSLWQKADEMVGNTAKNLISIISGAAGPGTANVPAKAGGGYVSGMAIVGDSPSGDMSTAEVVVGTFSVIPHGESVRRGLIPGSGIARYVNGTGNGNGGGDQYNLTFVASGNTSTDEQMFQRLVAWVNSRDRAREINLRRNSMGARNAAEGGGRY